VAWRAHCYDNATNDVGVPSSERNMGSDGTVTSANRASLRKDRGILERDRGVNLACVKELC
jgi:hypothetical protein